MRILQPRKQQSRQPSPLIQPPSTTTWIQGEHRSSTSTTKKMSSCRAIGGKRPERVQV